MNVQELLVQYLSCHNSSANIHIEPLAEEICKIVHRSLSKREVGDLEDFEEDCFVAVWARIESIKQGAPVDAIDNLEGFIRRTVHNRYCDAIRRKRPSWYNLKLEILETFSGKLNIEGFAIWQSPTGSERLCGFTIWQGRSDSATGACRELSDDSGKFFKHGLSNRGPAEFPVVELAAAILDWVGGPVEVDALTSCIAGFLQVRDSEPLSIDSQPDGDDEAGSPLNWLISSDVDVEEQVIGQNWLKQVISWFWIEFGQLSIKQRKAIFFGLSAEQAISIATACGIEKTAEALELDPKLLAGLIGKLPLPDMKIADELNLPAHAVPSVRFKAWRRIQRRARKSELAGIM